MRHVDRNGVTIFSMTPLNGLTFTYDEVYLASFVNPNIDAWVMSTYENRYLTKEAIDAVEDLVNDETDRQIRLYGRFISRTGLVMSNFDPEIHVYDPDDKIYDDWDNGYPPKYYIHVVGIDPGWGHPTGVIWMAMNPSTKDKYIYMEHKEAGKDTAYHAKVIKATNNMIGVRKPIYVIDSQAKAKEHSSGSSSYQIYAKHGITPRLGTKKLIDGNMKLNSSLKIEEIDGFRYSKTHISKECTRLIQEIGQYQRAPETNIQNRERFIDKNNDLIAAWRYANWELDKLTYGDMEDFVDYNNNGYIRKGSLLTGY